MTKFLPPKPVYPKDYDSDETLFMVYNTSETVTTSQNGAWSEEISIKPVAQDRPEIWADNGFATINGELFYYYSVEKTEPIGYGAVFGAIEVDENGSILQIPVVNGGSGYAYPTMKIVSSNGKGAKIEASVQSGSITEITIIEGGAGYSREDAISFEGKINKFKRCYRNLGGSKTKDNPAGTEVRGFVIAEHHNQLVNAIINAEKFIGVNFDQDKETLDWRIRNLESLPIIFDDYTCPDVVFDFYIVSSTPLGTTAQYSISIQGNFTVYRLDFGDGQFTTESTAGEHFYAINSNIDPVLTLSNDKCQIVMTPVSRESTRDPSPAEPDDPFEILIPSIPNVFDFAIPEIPTVEPPVIPPIVFPCVDVGPIGPIDIPSIIVVDPPIPTLIDFGPLPNIPTTIDFGPLGEIPTLIEFGPVPNIYVDVQICIPTLIEFSPIDIPTLITVDVDIPEIITVDVDIPEIITVNVDIPEVINVNVDIPEVINVNVDIPEIITVDVDIPEIINVNVDIPEIINIFDTIPNVINVISGVPSIIIVNADIPNIYVDVDIPEFINVIDEIPLYINVIDDIPVTINFDGYLPEVVNFSGYLPDVISFSGYLPPVINFTGYLPPVINVNVDIPNTINVYDQIPVNITVYDDIPNYIDIIENLPRTINVYFDPPPAVPVVWGPAPNVECTVKVVCESGGAGFRAQQEMMDGPDDSPETVEVSFGDLGIPSEILVKFPEVPDIKIIHDIPMMIKLDVPEIPDIQILAPENFPTEIKLVSDLPEIISMDIEVKGLPESIEVDFSNMPRSIPIVAPDSLPDIKIDASSIPDKIQVVGIPSAIELVGAPSEIKLVLPEKPEIELVYKGAPIDVKINLDVGRITGEGGNAQCVAIVPCPSK